MLAAKVAAESCPRSTCFVSIAYSGWAFRRQGVVVTKKGDIQEWIYPVTAGLAALSEGKKTKPTKSTKSKSTATGKTTGKPAQKTGKRA